MRGILSLFVKTHAFLLGVERRLMVGYESQTTGLSYSKFSLLLACWISGMETEQREWKWRKY